MIPISNVRIPFDRKCWIGVCSLAIFHANTFIAGWHTVYTSRVTNPKENGKRTPTERRRLNLHRCTSKGTRVWLHYYAFTFLSLVCLKLICPILYRNDFKGPHSWLGNNKGRSIKGFDLNGPVKGLLTMCLHFPSSGYYRV